MKLYEMKIRVDMEGDHNHIDDDALLEMCDTINEVVEEAADRLAELVAEIAAEKNVKLNVYTD